MKRVKIVVLRCKELWGARQETGGGRGRTFQEISCPAPDSWLSVSVPCSAPSSQGWTLTVLTWKYKVKVTDCILAHWLYSDSYSLLALGLSEAVIWTALTFHAYDNCAMLLELSVLNQQRPLDISRLWLLRGLFGDEWFVWNFVVTVRIGGLV